MMALPCVWYVSPSVWWRYGHTPVFEIIDGGSSFVKGGMMHMKRG